METEVARRSAADGLTERSFSRLIAVVAVAVLLVGVVLTVLSSSASGPGKFVGVAVSLGSVAGLLAFGLLGRGSLVVPVWMVTFISALCTMTFDYPIADNNGVSRRVVRAGLLGLAIVAAAVASQFAADRRFATPVAPGQVRVSALTLVLQIASATLGLVALVVVLPARSVVAYGWFVAGAIGLFGLVIAGAAGLRRG